MKKKLVWSFSHIMNDTPAQVVKLQTLWLSITAIIAGYDFIESNNNHTVTLLLIGAFVDKIILGGLNYKNV